MPSIIQGAPDNGGGTVRQSLDYRYPNGLDLRPGSELHSRIVRNVMRMADLAYEKNSQRFPQWNKTDETLKVFIPLNEAERVLKKSDKTKPVSIVVPYSYATLETLLAYQTKAFLTDTPFQYEGSSPQDSVQAKLLELVVNQQVHRFKSVLEMHTAFRDGFSYGYGMSTLNWAQKWGKKPQVSEEQKFSLFGTPLPTQRVKSNVDALLFEGNEVIGIDPYRCLRDPNVSVHNVQNGEFVGWLEFKSINKLLTEEANGGMFNVRYVNQGGNAQAHSRYQADNSKRIVSRDTAFSQNGTTKYVTQINMYVTLVPKEWGLPAGLDNNKNGEYPEIWLFTLLNDSTVVRAAPLGLNHGQYPIAVNAPDYDGYSPTPLARMELVSGLQTVLDWLFNSHITNVRKSLNDMLIVDPSLVNLEDVENPEPGKLIKMRRSAWGRGVENAVKQLAVQDVTRGHINDADFVMSIMQKASAATDATMGVMREGGERRSASEFSGTMQMAVSRLEHLARITSVQYIQDLAYFHASHTQQLMSQEVYVKAVGDWPDVLAEEFARKGMLGNRVPASPFDVICDFDIIFKDASHASADAIANDFWTKTFQVLSTNQALLQKFDITRIFSHMARINGAKNVQDFIIRGGDVNATTAPDQDVADAAQAGNLIDMHQFMQMRGAGSQAG